MVYQRMLLVVALVCVACGAVHAQDLDPIKTYGFVLGHDQLSGSIDNIDLVSGKLNLTIPLGSLPRGKGGMSYSLDLRYESRLYHLYPNMLEIAQSGTPPVDPYFYPYGYLGLDMRGGWSYSESNSYRIIGADSRNISLKYTASEFDLNCRDYGANLVRYNIVLPGGTSHVLYLRDQSLGTSDGYYGNWDGCAQTYLSYPIGATNPVWYTNDGSYLKYEDNSAFPGTGAGKLYFPDGRMVVRESDSVYREYDANGNYIVHRTSGNTTTISHDETPVAGRKIEIIGGVETSSDGKWRRTHVVVPGPNGDVIYAIDWQLIDQPGKQYVMSSDPYPVADAYRYETLPSVGYMIRYIQMPHRPHVALGTAPPADNSYEFRYDSDYHYVNYVRTPTGSTYEYEYGSPPECATLHPYAEAYQIASCQYVKKKTVTYDSGKSLIWEFTTHSFVDPDKRKVVYHYDDPIHLDKVTKIEEFDASGGAPIKRKETVRSWSGTSANPQQAGSMSNSWIAKEIVSVFNPSGGGVKSAITTYNHDANGRLLEKKEYDWVNYGTVNPSDTYLKRRTTYDHYVPATSANSYAAAHNTSLWPAGTARRLDAVKRVTVYQGTSTPKAATEYIYDSPYSKGNVTYERRWDSKKASVLPSLGGLTSSNSQQFQFQYDAYGNLVDKWEPSVGAAGSPRTHITYTNNSLVEYVYTGYGTPAQRTLKYDWYNNGAALWAKTDVDNNLATVYEYDNIGRQTSALQTSGTVGLRGTWTTYDDASRKMRVESDLKAFGDGLLQTVTHYDMLGRVTLVQQSDGTPLTESADSGIKVKTEAVYPETGGGRLVITTTPYRTLTDATLEWTCTQHDAVGRVTRVARFKGTAQPTSCTTTTNRTGETVTAYDADVTTVTDPALKVRSQRVDGLGRLVEVVEDPGTSPKLNYSTTYSYDALGNLTQVVQGSQTRTFTYSSLSRLISATNPESDYPTNYDYYDSGDLQKKTDARGTWMEMAYDPLRRIVTKTYSDSTPPVTYEYYLSGSASSPSIGQLKSVASSVASTIYNYDSLGNVARTASIISGLASTQFFSYDWYLNGSLESIRYPSGRLVNYSVDDAGRTNRVYAGSVNYADMTAAGISYPFYPDGRIAQMKLGNGLYETMDFRTPGTPTVYRLGTTLGGGNLTQLTYNFSATGNNGNVSSQIIERPGNTWQQTHTYDSLNRLLTAAESLAGSWSRGYGYDRYGNRHVASSTGIAAADGPEPTLPGHFNAANNRLTMAGTGYDTAGNQTTYGSFTLEYDAESRNTAVNASGSPYVSFAYDGEGRRVKKAANGVTTYYVYDALGRLAVEYSQQAPTSTGTSYLFMDMLGSVRTITNQSGAVVECYDYLPFGRMLGSGSHGRGSCYPNPPDVGYSSRTAQKFTGKERDAETGLDYFGARYLSSPQGRFTSPDPFNIIFDAENKDDFNSFISQPQNWNKYAYTWNNPLRYVDPSGERVELIGSADERRTALDYLCQIIGRCDEDLGLKISEEDGHYFVDIQGNVGDFKNMNDQAFYLANLIGHSSTVEFGVTSADLRNLGGAATLNPGEAGNQNVRVLVNPNQTSIGDNRLRRSPMGVMKFEGWNESPPWEVKPLTTGIAIWHEFGHAWGKIHGRLRNPASDLEAIGWENKMRKAIYGPLGPHNARRIKH